MSSVIIFTDCMDPNAESRQKTRWEGIYGSSISVNCYAVKHSIEASFCVVDTIFAATLPLLLPNSTSPLVIVGNVAPRNEKNGGKIYENGAPFCYGFTKEKNILVIGTPDVFVLPVKEGLIEDVYETDAYRVCKHIGIFEEQALRISKSQFRSLEYVPYLFLGIDKYKKDISFPRSKIFIDSAKFNNEVAWTDNFGNMKTTVKKSDLTTTALSEISSGKIQLHGKSTSLNFYERLKDMPNGETAVVRGSSGVPGDEYLEIIKRGGNASEEPSLNLKLGYPIFQLPVYAEV